ncbi:YhdT family protein [Pseudobacillus badius]|uniref:YhdT family protein n=1 Tax=Bacillus badius TaxID=1455 RepID=UPI001CBF9005|nr:YhdT family protein [Bacillus badius]MED0665892.1 YhdT family protein [Bacillus badius]UAT32107.1 YhdT family protein [Bacillus badius]GLY11163.1 sodium:pantothenate symporter [Bacillus badius]
MKKEKQEDSRFIIAKKEAWIGILLVIFNFIWWYGFAYGLGRGPVEKYRFIFGLPAWFFYSCIVGLIVMILLVVFTVTFFFKEVPFDEEGENR